MAAPIQEPDKCQVSSVIHFLNAEVELNTQVQFHNQTKNASSAALFKIQDLPKLKCNGPVSYAKLAHFILVQGKEFVVWLHDSRALTELKQSTATPLPHA
uniref:Uncharacterized protein n=1 Tax=Timema tahoe TaxID=61484 RepID=A0A7R9IQG1_9NEOP|nr:unnamed protein product [Timema tahoe]